MHAVGGSVASGTGKMAASGGRDLIVGKACTVNACSGRGSGLRHGKYGSFRRGGRSLQWNEGYMH